MGLFSVEYRNDPGRAVFAQGGLKFRADEEALERYFAPILSSVGLQDLLGEAGFWVLLPSTLAIWSFPFLVYFIGAHLGVVSCVVLFFAAYVWHLFFYVKPMNYLVFLFGNRGLQFVAYIATILVFVSRGFTGEAILFAMWFVAFAVGLDQLVLLPLIPIFSKLLALPPSDQVLRNVGWYYGRRMGLDPKTWKMQ